ncbi:MAG: Rieske 2Fe-2S domain-containing protein [Actinomycetota bacterium]|nr:Rieske 2Fe-2S domain-containing protein [Actinomycetota bacterium]
MSDSGQRPLPARFNRQLESLTWALERSRPLSLAGKMVSRPVAKLVGTGPVKDLLSGTWLGHPVHPMLTDVPIGAWTSALVLDLTGIFGGAGAASRRGADTLVAVGVVTALPTAVSGVSDLSDEVEDSILAVGAAHAIGNVVALGLFTASWAARLRRKRARGIALSVLGMGALAASGFLGGHLSYRKGLGVDHTVFEEPIGDWTAVLDASELADGNPQQVTVAGNDVLLYRATSAVYALANRCSHRGGPLHEGKIEGEEIVCPWHSSRFRIQDGSVVRGPAVAPQPCYEARVHQGKIEVRSRT